MRLLYVTVADERIGLGHVNRCLSMAEENKIRQENVEFLVFGDSRVEAFMDRTAYHYTTLPMDNLTENLCDLSHLSSNEFDVAVIDVVHSEFFHSGSKKKFFDEIRKIAPVVAAVDALGQASFLAQYPDVDIDLLIVPYVVDEYTGQSIRKVGRRQLIGADYAVLRPEYHRETYSNVREHANRVFLTCGGSDPTAMTPQILAGLEAVKRTLEIRVALGPLFNDELCSKLYKFSDASKHSISCLAAPKNLAEHMVWCDLAISASGLTKYELAATRTPAILFSIDEAHNLVNLPFAELGTVWDMGVLPSPEMLREKVIELLNNAIFRKRMAQKGGELVDGKGARRLMLEIEKELSCKRKM